MEADRNSKSSNCKRNNSELRDSEETMIAGVFSKKLMKRKKPVPQSMPYPN